MVELTYLHVIVKSESLLGAHSNVHCVCNTVFTKYFSFFIIFHDGKTVCASNVCVIMIFKGH